MKKNNYNFQSIKNQDGYVSILVTLFIILILSLITIGFSQLARRERQLAFERQLATEALYAAESGVNDTIKYINKNGTSLIPNADDPKVGCSNTGDLVSGGSGNRILKVPTVLEGILGISGQSEYTCLLVDKSPSSLEYSSVDQSNQIYADINTSSHINELVIGWESADPTITNVFSRVGVTFPKFNEYDDWNDNGGTSPMAPVLRVDITAIPTNMPNYSRDNLLLRTFTGYLYPVASGSSTRYSFSSGQNNNRGIILQANCVQNRVVSADFNFRDCYAVINGLPFTAGVNETKRLFVRISSIYGPARVSIEAVNTQVSSTLLDITGAQNIIDVTAKAGESLRRQQARISRVPKNISNYAIETVGSICKKITVTSTSNDFKLGVTGNDSACKFYDQE